MTAGRIAGAVLATAMLGIVANAQEIGASPSHGVLNLSARFMPDPVSIESLSVDAVDADEVAGCDGVTSAVPSLGLQYEAGGFPLVLSASSNPDSVLMVRGPDGN
jgi:hypothetical protein